MAMEHIMMELLAKCEDADMILVGIGEEFQYDWDILIRNERYQEIEDEIGESEEDRWVIPFIQKMFLEECPDALLSKAYENLKNIVDGKNYFILSTVMDDCIYQHGFDEERIVTPCGGFRNMQCDNNCNGKIFDIDDKVYEEVKAYYDKELRLVDLKEPLCSQCGRKKRFNQLGVSKYAEEGYLPQWEKYTKWLQKTINRKVCVIELGAGMQLPTIIRWPFEKIIHYNQKSFLYRIHSSLYQLGENMGERGIGLKENSVKFLANGFVK